MALEDNREMLKAITTTELSSGVLPRDLFDEFYMEVQKQSNVLGEVRTVTLPREKMTIPQLALGERKRSAQSEGTAIDSTKVSTSGVEMDAVKGAIYWELTRESVEDVSDSDIADKIMAMMSNQFSVDTEDLAFVGTEETTEISETVEEADDLDGSKDTFEIFLQRPPASDDKTEVRLTWEDDSSNTFDQTLDDETNFTILEWDSDTGYLKVQFDSGDEPEGDDLDAHYKTLEWAQQNDGWIELAYDAGCETVNCNGEDLDLEDINSAITAIDSKYLRADPAIFLNRTTMQNMLWDIVDNRTGLGDSIIRGDADINPFGYTLIPCSTIPRTKALFTIPENLIYGLYKEVQVSTLFESDDIHEKDLYGKYKITVRDDFQIEETDAVVVIEDIKI